MNFLSKFVLLLGGSAIGAACSAEAYARVVFDPASVVPLPSQRPARF